MHPFSFILYDNFEFRNCMIMNNDCKETEIRF